jgi:amino acid permease
MGDSAEPFIDNEKGDNYDDEILLFSPEMRQMFYQDDSGTGTFKGSIANLVNSAIGAGVLALPFAFQQSGVFMGILLSIGFCPLVTFTLHIMGRAQKASNEGSYQATCQKLLGPTWGLVNIVFQLSFIMGACVGFLIIISDNLQPQFIQWFGSSSFISQRPVVILLSLIPITPMCFIKNIQKISPLATFSIIAIVYTVGMMITRAALELKKEGFPPMIVGEITEGITGCRRDGDGFSADCYQVSSFRENLSVLKAMPVFCFAYNVHTTHSLVFAEMAKPKTLTKMDRASGASLLFCASVYIICGLVGYWYTEAHKYNGEDGDKPGTVPGNVLLIYPPEIDVAIARICIAVSVVGSFTTLHFSGFYCWQDLLVKKVPGKKCEFTPMQATAERILFIGFCTGMAMVAKQLDVVLDLTGALAIIPMMFCFPGMLQLKLNEIVNNGEDFPFYNAKSRFWGYFLIAFGLILSLASFSVTILSIAGVIKD